MNQQKLAVSSTRSDVAPGASTWPPRRIEARTVTRLLEHGHAQDNTAYARGIGYNGERSVIVLDGKVISHRWTNWFDFCAACRSRARRKMH
jgi:hypothetical protein